MKPLGIYDLFGISLCYLLIAWIPSLLLAVSGTLVAIMLRFIRRPLFGPVLKASWLFAILLLLSGWVFNIVWNVLIFGRLYWAFDYAGFECSPFGLIIYSEVNVPAQYFHGMTAGTIHGLWAVYAFLSWGTAAWATYAIMKRKWVICDVGAKATI